MSSVGAAFQPRRSRLKSSPTQRAKTDSIAFKIKNQDVTPKGPQAENAGATGGGSGLIVGEAYFRGVTPRSLQILPARMSLISVWRGTAERLF
jgi:hypothetical protein